MLTLWGIGVKKLSQAVSLKNVVVVVTAAVAGYIYPRTRIKITLELNFILAPFPQKIPADFYEDCYCTETVNAMHGSVLCVNGAVPGRFRATKSDPISRAVLPAISTTEAEVT